MILLGSVDPVRQPAFTGLGVRKLRGDIGEIRAVVGCHIALNRLGELVGMEFLVRVTGNASLLHEQILASLGIPGSFHVLKTFRLCALGIEESGYGMNLCMTLGLIDFSRIVGHAVESRHSRVGTECVGSLDPLGRPILGGLRGNVLQVRSHWPIVGHIRTC